MNPSVPPKPTWEEIVGLLNRPQQEPDIIKDAAGETKKLKAKNELPTPAEECPVVYKRVYNDNNKAIGYNFATIYKVNSDSGNELDCVSYRAEMGDMYLGQTFAVNVLNISRIYHKNVADLMWHAQVAYDNMDEKPAGFKPVFKDWDDYQRVRAIEVEAYNSGSYNIDGKKVPYEIKCDTKNCGQIAQFINGVAKCSPCRKDDSYDARLNKLLMGGDDGLYIYSQSRELRFVSKENGIESSNYKPDGEVVHDDVHTLLCYDDKNGHSGGSNRDYGIDSEFKKLDECLRLCDRHGKKAVFERHAYGTRTSTPNEPDASMVTHIKKQCNEFNSSSTVKTHRIHYTNYPKDNKHLIKTIEMYHPDSECREGLNCSKIEVWLYYTTDFFKDDDDLSETREMVQRYDWSIGTWETMSGIC